MKKLYKLEQLKDKKVSFLAPKIWNTLSSNQKIAATTASFSHRLKKQILNKLQEWAVLLIFFYSFFYYISLWFITLGEPKWK